MTWADDMENHAKYFVEKFDEGHDWYYPDHLEEQANYPYTKDEVKTAFGDLGRFADVEKILDSVRLQIIALDAASEKIDQDFCESAIGDMEIYLENWQGNGADNFRSYLKGHPGVEVSLARIRDRLLASKSALTAYRNTISRFRDDVNSLVEKAQDGIEAGELTDEKIRATLVSAAVSAVVGGVTAGAGWVATLAVGAALQAGTTGAAMYQLGSSSKEAIIASLPEQSYAIIDSARLELGKVSAAFDQVSVHLVGGALPEVRPPRPRIVTDDKFKPGDFERENPPKDVSDQVRTDDLVKEPGKETDTRPGNPGNDKREKERRKEEQEKDDQLSDVFRG